MAFKGLTSRRLGGVPIMLNRFLLLLQKLLLQPVPVKAMVVVRATNNDDRTRNILRSGRYRA